MGRTVHHTKQSLPSLEKWQAVTSQLSFPDSLKTITNCDSLAIHPQSFIDLNFYHYLNRVTEEEALEAYWADWHWLNYISDEVSTFMLFDFGEDNYLMPFLLDDGFFPGAVSGVYAVYQNEKCLCAETFDHYSTADIEVPSGVGESETIKILQRDFQQQFWRVLSDSVGRNIRPPIPSYLQSR
jgi:hypothetical protein